MHTQIPGGPTRRAYLLSTLALAMLGATPGAFGQSAAERWDAVYREGHPRLPAHPNRFLEQMVANLPPGRALDVGMGQGRNALFLARRGWRVVGIDISGEAVKQVNAAASRERLPLEARRIALEDYPLEQERFDLIVLMYVHNLAREEASRMAKALRPGGRLVLEAYHVDVASAGLNAITGVPRGYREDEMLRLFDELHAERCTRESTKSDWSNGPDGTAPLIRFVGIHRP